MSSKTKIEWTKGQDGTHGATWNPVTGCTKKSQGCKNCYAEREWSRMQHLPRFAGRAFTDVVCHPDRLDQPLRWKKPRRIFVNSMSDLFHESVPDEFIDEVFRVMGACEDAQLGHIFQILTKRPKRMRQYLSERAHRSWNLGRLGPDAFPPRNIWLGVSVEDQQTADERIPLLLQTPAAVRWISAEPLLGPIDLYYLEYAALNWVVVGGESGPNARPMHPDWARSIRDWCKALDIPFFFKQWGEWFPGEEPAWPENADYQVASGKGYYFDSGQWMEKVGKKQAGNLLDGKKWEQYP